MIDADAWTQDRLDDMESHLKEVYEEAYKDLDKKTKEHFAKMHELDAKKKKLVESGKLSQEEYERWRRTQLFQGQQMKAMTQTVAQELLKVNQIATAYVNGQIPSVYTFNYNTSGQDIEGQVSGYSFDIYDEQTVMNLSTEDSSLLPYKEVNGQKDIRWNTKQVNSEVLQGIIQGESIPEIASRLEKVTGMNRASAIRNARTSMTSAQNKGRIDSYRRAQQDGVILKKKWLAANQPGRTRDWHAELNNVESDVEKPFFNSYGKIMYPGDPYAKPANVYNCRCTLVSVVKGFKKVGENTAKNVDNTAESGIIKTVSDKATISNIESPIEQRNTTKGNPNAIYHFDVDLNERQKLLLEQLPEFNSQVVVDKKNVNMSDLSALTAKTGCEFAMFTKGSERLIIRGNNKMVNVDIQMAQELAKAGYRWSGHTHPGDTFFVMQPSDGDYAILACFKQESTAIYNSIGNFRTFEKRSDLNV